MEKTEVLNRTERANSFSGRYGGVGTDFKIYFDTIEELKSAIDTVIAGKIHLEKALAEPIEVKEND